MPRKTAEKKKAARARAEEEAVRVAVLAQQEAARVRAEEEAVRARTEKEAVRVAVLAQQEAARVRYEEEAARTRAEDAAAEEEAARVRAEKEDIERQHVLYRETMTSPSSTFSKMEKFYVDKFQSSNGYRDRKHNWKWDKGYLSCRVFRQPRLINNPISSLLSFQLPENFTQLKMNMTDIFGCSESNLRRIMKFGNTDERDEFLKSCYQENGWDKNELGRGTIKGHKYKFAFTTKPSSLMHVKFMDMNVQLSEVAYSATCVSDDNESIKYNISLKFQMADFFSITEDFEDSDGNVVSYPKFALEMNYHVSNDSTASLSGKIPCRLLAVERNEGKSYFRYYYNKFRKLVAPEKKEFIVSSGKYKMKFDKYGILNIS